MASQDATKEILDRIFRDAQHYGGLRECRLDVSFPLLEQSPESPLPCRETPAEAEAVESHFSGQIHAFFAALHDFEKKSTSSDGDEYIRKEGLWLTIRVVNQSFTCFPKCLHRRFHSHRLSVRDPDALPQLRRVTKLRLAPEIDGTDFELDRARPVSLRAPLELLTHLPAVQELDCPWLWERMPVAFRMRSLRHFTRPWEGPWRDARHEFGAAAQELDGRLPGSLTKARLWFWKPDAFCVDEDQGIWLPNLTRPDGSDPLSLGLRTVASHLEHLDLRAFLTADLFKPPVSWPRMKRLKVEFHPWCPDGKWYFVGPRGENPHPDGGFEITREEHYPPIAHSEHDDQLDAQYLHESYEGEEEDERDTDMFRTVPLRDKIEPLLSAFAAALRGMPAVEEAELFTYLAWQASEQRREEYEDAEEEPYSQEYAIFRWGIRYVPGRDGAQGTVTWQVGEWRPREEVIEAFESLGGEAGVVRSVWTPFVFSDSRNQDYVGAL
jgi:hypothetical protein